MCQSFRANETGAESAEGTKVEPARWSWQALAIAENEWFYQGERQTSGNIHIPNRTAAALFLSSFSEAKTFLCEPLETIFYCTHLKAKTEFSKT
jgi:hypothetical protein